MFLFWIDNRLGKEKCSDSYPEGTKGGAWGTQRSTYTAAQKDRGREKWEQEEASTSRWHIRKNRPIKCQIKTRWPAERIWKFCAPCGPATTDNTYSTCNSLSSW